MQQKSTLQGVCMYIDDFIWLPDIVEKLAIKHYVTQDEVEEVFFNQPRYRFVESGHRPSEDVYAACGQTDAGRYLIVFFIHKTANIALILSARDMDEKERRHYERK
jgi:hypothetical protein